MRPTQEVTLCIRATRRMPSTNEDVPRASNILLASARGGIDALATPHTQFFQLSSKAVKLAAAKVKFLSF